MRRNIKRNDAIVSLYRNGSTQKNIAKLFSISPCRVQQIIWREKLKEEKRLARVVQ